MRGRLPSWIRRLELAVAWLMAATLGGCGYVGDTLPPALYIPLPVTDLRALQEGGEIIVRFTMPTRSTEDLPLEGNPEIDLRAAIWENRDWDEGAWERESQRLPVEVDEESRLTRTPVNGFIGRRVLLRVRVAGQKGRFSSWSEPVALRVLGAQQSPSAVSATPTAEGVSVSWELPAQDSDGVAKLTEVWRRQGAESEFRLVGVASQSPYVDDGSVYGEPHSYRLRSRVEGEEFLALSRFSDSVNVIPVDTFAPASPVDVSAIAGASSVELSWTRNPETDLAGYRVYRAVDNGDFVPLSEVTPGVTFSDSSAPTAVRLRYRITALDTVGNESVPSAVMELVLP